MIDDEPEIDVPEGWVTETCRFSGNFKLIAEFEHEGTGAEIRITPYKTYSQPGFCNAHRVILVHPDEGVEEIAVGMTVEHVEDAEAIAVEKMEELSLSQ